MSCSISLVVPILNEAESLPELLAAIEAQTLRPNELLFVDAGSTDGGGILIQAWWESHAWPEGSCRVISLPGAMPGAGRNAGVKASEGDWVAFIDGGIVPDLDWIERLYTQAIKNSTPAVFGVCHFSADAAFSRSVCALSYGQGTIHPVIPASLFNRSVFDAIGYFPKELRAAEDIVWVKRFIQYYCEREVCTDARVRYTHFPTNWREAYEKWMIFEYHSVLAGTKLVQRALYLIILPVIYIAPFVKPTVGIGLFLLYVLLRGVLDPMRRSMDKPWWGDKPSAGLIAPLLAGLLDNAKLVGIVQALVAKLTGITKD